MIRVSTSLLFLALLTCSCSTPQTARLPRFNEQEYADFIVRYYTDDTNYVLKPAATDGPFLSVLNKEAVLEVAKRQPGRQLAVVIMIHHGAPGELEGARHKWENLLTQAGYERVVFLGAARGMQANGLPVLAKGG